MIWCPRANCPVYSILLTFMFIQGIKKSLCTCFPYCNHQMYRDFSITLYDYYYYYYHHHHHHHPCYHLYARYLQLYTWNTHCLYGTQCFSCSLFTVCATCNDTSTVIYVSFIFTFVSFILIVLKVFIHKQLYKWLL